jgi:hypothetical protein
MHECPDGYDGWFGSPIGRVIAGSACDGRMNQSVQAVASSVAAMATLQLPCRVMAVMCSSGFDDARASISFAA